MTKKIKITESQLSYLIKNIVEEELEKQPVKYRNRLKGPTEDNPISIFMHTPLREGMYRTYPPQTTVRYMKEYFDLSNDEIGIDTQNSSQRIIIQILNYAENIQDVIKGMNLCGYFLAMPKYFDGFKEGEKLTLTFEARNSLDIRKEIESDEVLYHITPKYNLEKILRFGFTPKTKNGLFNYPHRVYFLRGNLDPEEIINLGQELCYNNNSYGNDGKYVLFQIDISKIPQNVTFFYDPDYKNGVYTMSNIPPDVIIDYSEREY